MLHVDVVDDFPSLVPRFFRHMPTEDTLGFQGLCDVMYINNSRDKMPILAMGR
jgi:hypothetical protein